MHVLLRREGRRVNHTLVLRVYGEAGLHVRRRRRKPVAVPRSPMEMPTSRNERWSMDVVSDALGDGRKFRALTIVDDFTRECPAIEVDLSLSGERVAREERLAKAQLASLIDDVIRERALTQQDAAVLMGIDQPKVSHLLRGRLSGFSTQRLIDFLNALGRDVEIVVRAAPKFRKRGRMHVAA